VRHPSHLSSPEASSILDRKSEVVFLKKQINFEPRALREQIDALARVYQRVTEPVTESSLKELLRFLDGICKEE
jgi:hypothetical protein